MFMGMVVNILSNNSLQSRFRRISRWNGPNVFDRNKNDENKQLFNYWQTRRRSVNNTFGILFKTYVALMTG